MMIAYLGSSAIVKCYVLEPGSGAVAEVYGRVLDGEPTLSFSAWNIGEVLGVLDRYRRWGWLSREDYEMARRRFVSETLRLLRLLKVVPVKTRLLVQAWPVVERYHVYEAGALQVVSARRVGAGELYTGGEQVHEVELKEGINSTYLG